MDVIEEKANMFELSSEQQDTAAQLKELLGQTMADRYVDVCSLSAGAFPLHVSAPIAAHAMREFESSLRAILEVPMDAKVAETEENKERIATARKSLRDLGFDNDAIEEALKKLRAPKHKNQIRKIVGRLDLDVNGDIAAAWIAICAAVETAHNRKFNQTLKVDEDYRAKLFEPFQTVVRGVAIAFRKQYLSLVLRVEKIIAMPDRAAATKLFSAEIPWALPLHWHFFQRLETGDWLPHLIEEGLLASPPPASRAENEKGARMSEWPAGHYLSAMAKSSDAKTRRLVVEALKAVAASNHQDIRRQGIEVLTALPAAEAAPHVDVAVNWLVRDGNTIIIDRARQLVMKLANGQQKEAALKLARALLQIWDNSGNIANLFGHHMYEYHLPVISKSLTECCGLDALDLYLDLLNQASTVGGWGEYMHYSTRPFIENATPADGVYGALASTVTMTAKNLIEEKNIPVADIVTRIAAYSPKMFMRIAMHVLASNAAGAPGLVDEYLLNPQFIGVDWCKEEYAELANERFPSLKPEQQAFILKTIKAIPDEFRDSWKARFEGDKKVPPTVEDIKKFDDSCFRDLVWEWRGVLPEGYQQRLRDIEAELGDPDAWKEKFFPTEVSPLEASDFASRSVADVAAFLKTWRPAEESQSQTITALSQALRTAVTLNAKKYAEEADLMIGAAPIYLRRTLEGIQNAVGNGGDFPWSKILKLIDYALEQFSKPNDPAMAAEGDDRDWMWACIAAADLLATGLRRGAGCIGFDNAAAVQAAVLKLSAIAPREPGSEDFEEKYQRNAYFTSQSTMRGIAVEACVLTVYWLSKDPSTEIGIDGRSPEDLPTDVRARGYAYWDARLAAAKSSSDPDNFRSEIGSFGGWCTGKQDAVWLLEQLPHMLAAGFAPNQSFGVVEWLGEMAPEHPDAAVECILALFSNKYTDQWAHIMHDGAIRSVLTNGLAHGTDKTKKLVEQTVSVLSSKGETKFTDILPRAA